MEGGFRQWNGVSVVMRNEVVHMHERVLEFVPLIVIGKSPNERRTWTVKWGEYSG